MTLPALVIGLGGTGQWVLTHLKKNLIENNQGTMPKSVKLLAFDTVETVEVSVSSVALVNGTEFFSFGKNLQPVIKEIANGKYRNLEWLPAKELLNTLPPVSFNIRAGARQTRSLSRLALFDDILRGQQESTIIRVVKYALWELKQVADIGRSNPLQVIIISSLAGGTGGAIIIDIPFLVRAIAEPLLLSDALTLKGFFVLPRVFMHSGLSFDRTMMARSFAAWRELDLFSSTGADLTASSFYKEILGSQQIPLGTRPYDISYLVDSARHQRHLQEITLTDGVCPLIANVITAFVDEESIRHDRTYLADLAGARSHLPSRTHHSVIGAYTLKLPVLATRERLSIELAIQALENLLAPVKNDGKKVTSVFAYENREVQESEQITQAVLNFLQESRFVTEQQTLTYPRFLSAVAEVYGHPGRIDSLIDQLARAHGSNPQNNFFRALTEVGVDYQGLYEIRKFYGHISEYVTPSEVTGDTPFEAIPRIEAQMQRMKAEFYGYELATGTRQSGRFYEVLRNFGHLQTEHFARLLREWTEHNLNGDKTSDPIVAKSGKIGYVIAFCEELLRAFSQFVQLVRASQELSKSLKPYRDVQEQAQRALYHYKAKSQEQGFFDRLRRQAYKAQEQYLEAEQRVLEILRDEILLDVLIETALAFRLVVSQLLEEINAWVEHLAVGSNGFLSVLERSYELLHRLELYQKEDAKLSSTKEIEYDYSVTRVRTEDIRAILGRLKWSVGSNFGEFAVAIQVLGSSGEQEGEKIYRNQQAIQKNVKILQAMARSEIGSRVEGSIIKVLLERYTPSEVAQILEERAHPFWIPSSQSRNPEYKVGSIYIQIDRDPQEASYVNALKHSVMEYLKLRTLNVYSAEASHTLILTQSDDLIPSNNFELWHRCSEAYIQYIGERSQSLSLHVFPATIEANYYEVQIPKLLKQPFRILNERTVGLLADRELFESFFWCCALGYVRWEITREDKFVCTLVSPFDQTAIPLVDTQDNSKEDIFDALQTYLYSEMTQRSTSFWIGLREKISPIGRSDENRLLRDLRTQLNRGIVQTLELIVKKHPNIQEYKDLVDIARIFYLQAIQGLRETGAEEVSLLVSQSRTQVRTFFEDAGFSVKETYDSRLLILQPELSNWRRDFRKPLLVALAFGDKEVEREAIKNHFENYKKESIANALERVVFLVVNQQIHDSAWIEIAAIRAAEKVQFIPIDDILIQKSLEDGRVRTTLETHIKRFVGKGRNLYDRSLPITDRLNFFGRESLAEMLLEQLGEGQPIGLFGLRKIGKTSLLNYLSSNQPLLVYVDLEAGDTLLGFCRRVLLFWERAISTNYNWNWKAPRLDEQSDPSAAFVTAVNELMGIAARPQDVGILIDEIELITPHKTSTEEEIKNYLTFARLLRGLVQEGKMSLVVAGLDASFNRTNRLGVTQNPFYQFFQEVYLEPLHKADCIQMIRNIGQQMGLKYEEGAPEFVAEISGGHPFFARQLCGAAYEELDWTHTDIMTLSNLQKTTNSLISKPKTADLFNDNGLWGDMVNVALWTDDVAIENKVILLTLAEKETQPADVLLQNGPERTIRERAVHELQQWCVLSLIEGNYSIRFGLFRDWIRRYKLR